MNEIILLRTASQTGNTGAPLGLLYISSYLKQFGYNVTVLDLNFKKLDYELIKKAKIIGISMLSYLRQESYNLIRKFKQINKKAKIIVGGIHATCLPELLINNFPIDAVVIGEGELTMKDLADYWLKGKGELKKIKGIATKEFGIHEPRELIKNLDELPMPDYSQANIGQYLCIMAKNRPQLIINGIKISEAKFANIITSRGCKGRCTFCSNFIHWKYKVRFRSAKNILEEMKYLYSKGVRMFNFNDDSFGQNKGIVIELCKGIIDSGMKIAFYTAMRLDDVDEELLSWMNKAGCFVISYGIESGSDKILKNMNKMVTKDQIRRAVNLTKKSGIKAYALLMVGNKGETTETIQETIDLMNELQIDLYSTNGFVWIYPRTVYCKMMNIKDDFWLKGDGMPILYDNFTHADLNRWYLMIQNQVPVRW